MGLLGALGRGYVLRRLLSGSRGRRGGGRGYGSRPRQRGGQRRRDGFGFWGPVPSYSRTTRRGNRVRVGGCCLPILVLALTGLAAAVAAVL